MFRFVRNGLAALAFGLLTLTPSAATAQFSDATRTAIMEQLQRYERVLNGSDIETVMKLYAEDAVFMPQHSPPAVGPGAVRAAYRRVFDTFKLNIRFEMDEIRPLSLD